METSKMKELSDEKMQTEEKEEEDEKFKVVRRKDEMRTRQDELVKRGEKKDILRHFFIEKHEAEQEEAFIRAQEARELKCLQAEQTQKLGAELMRRKNAEIRQQKLRQLLRDDSMELRRLERQLREAYAAKAARSQLSQREIRRENSKITAMKEDLMIQGWYKDDKFDREKIAENKIRKEQYRRDLQEQLASNHRLRQQKIEETSLERKFVEDTLTLGSEDRKNERTKQERTSHLLAEQRDFLRAQETRKLKENQAILKENEERARILADKMSLENERKVAKSNTLAAREAIAQKTLEKILHRDKARKEWEDTINELIEEEKKNYLENRSREDILAKSRIAREMLEDMERQRISKGDSKAGEAKIDREFAEYLERERERFLMENRRKGEERRAIEIAYDKNLKDAIVNERLRYVQTILQNQAVLRRDRTIEEERLRSIEAERSRMLQEHDMHLRGFLNTGI